MRLDKALSDQGIGTRKEVRELIIRGRIRVNDETVRKADRQVSEADQVLFDGNPVDLSPYEYWILYKPAGYLTATEDRSKPTVMELIPSKRKDLAPVGRLDLDTEGLLLVTNDGDLSHRLLSPKYHVEKTYYAELRSDLPENAAELLSRPMSFSDFTAKPADGFEKLSARSARLTISEGKYHQVKRMFAKIGCEVLYLRRERFGPLNLQGLEPGEARKLTEEESKNLKKSGDKP